MDFAVKECFPWLILNLLRHLFIASLWALGLQMRRIQLLAMSSFHPKDWIFYSHNPGPLFSIISFSVLESLCLFSTYFGRLGENRTFWGIFLVMLKCVCAPHELHQQFIGEDIASRDFDFIPAAWFKDTDLGLLMFHKVLQNLLVKGGLLWQLLQKDSNKSFVPLQCLIF